MNFEDIEHLSRHRIDTFLSELVQDLKDKTYHPSPVRRVMIPKADGSQRPLGIATIRDRVAQMAVKFVMEPIFEADFCPNAYGFRPKKSAHDAVDEIADALYKGYTQVIDAESLVKRDKQGYRRQAVTRKIKARITQMTAR